MCAKCEEQQKASQERQDLFAVIIDGGRLVAHITAAGLVKVDAASQQDMQDALVFLNETDAVTVEAVRRLEGRRAFVHMVAGAILARVEQPVSAAVPNVPPSRGLN